jgi:hypothetical protein
VRKIIFNQAITHNVSIVRDDYPVSKDDTYLNPKLTENRDGFYIGFYGLRVKITFSEKASEDMIENEATSNEVHLERIEYFSSSADGEGNMTLRYLMHRSAQEEDAPDATPNLYFSGPRMILSAEEKEESDEIIRQVLYIGPNQDMDMKETDINQRKFDKVIEERTNAGKSASTLIDDIVDERKQSLMNTLSGPSEPILSAEEEEIPAQLPRQLMNIGTNPDMNKKETSTKRKSDKVIEELTNAGKSVGKFVNDIEAERHQLLRDTHQSMDRMKAMICSWYLIDGNSAGVGFNRSMMKGGLLEMIREFMASLTSEHPWPAIEKSTYLTLLANLVRDIEEDLKTPGIKAAMLKADPASQKEGYQQRLDEMVKWSAANMGIDKTDRHLGFGGKKLKLGNMRRLSPPDAKPGELRSRFLVFDMEKIYRNIRAVEARLNKIKNEAAPQTGVDAAIRSEIRDVNDVLTEFIERWDQPVPKDKLIAAQLLPGALPDIYYDKSTSICPKD